MTRIDWFDLWSMTMVTCLAVVGMGIVCFLVVLVGVTIFEAFFGPSILGELIR